MCLENSKHFGMEMRWFNLIVFSATGFLLNPGLCRPVWRLFVENYQETPKSKDLRWLIDRMAGLRS